MYRKLFVSHREKEYFVPVLTVLLLAVLFSASFAGSQSCYVCGGDGKVNCHECNGSGRCAYCGGDGKLGYVPSYGYGKGEDVRCTICSGSGRCSNCHGNRTETCTRCSGSGTIWAQDSNDGNDSNESNAPTNGGGSTTTDEPTTTGNTLNSPSGGGGGCNSGLGLLALAVLALLKCSH